MLDALVDAAGISKMGASREADRVTRPCRESFEELARETEASCVPSCLDDAAAIEAYFMTTVAD